MNKSVKILAFTGGGAQLAEQISSIVGKADIYTMPSYCRESHIPLKEPIAQWAARYFTESEALIFIGALGIVVRAVGPLLKSKGTDPAVVCVDDTGRFVIPVLSGHIGGANRLARQIAGEIGATAVITTATDNHGKFSPDEWAARQGCVIPRLEQIKRISAAILEEKPVGLFSEFPVEGKLPQGLFQGEACDYGIYIGLREKSPFPNTLWVLPRCLRLGIGCRKGVSPAQLQAFVQKVLQDNGLPIEAVCAVASHTLKQGEPALQQFASKFHLPLEFYTAEALQAVSGSSASSGFVQSVTGVDNVCERAALAKGGDLVVKKTAEQGITLAVVIQDWRASFCDC